MVQFNFSERTIKAKVVYYGPAQSGKTTNLEQVHVLTDPSGSNKLVSLNTAQDRTLFFDLLPFSLGQVSGYDFQVQLYTVPGQVQYNATRRVVLAGADAVVFVADSRRAMTKENVAAFENMKVNLLANRLVPEKVPLVLQWNKQDLPELMSEAELNKSLNPWGRPALGAVAFSGKGVLETFVAVVQQMLSAIAVKYNLKEKGLDPAAVPELVAGAFADLMKRAEEAKPKVAPGAAPASPPKPSKVVLTQTPDASIGPSLQASPDTGLVAEELLARSIKSNVEMAEALSGISRQMNDGLSMILSQAELLRVFRDDQRDKRAASIESIYTEALRLRKVVQDMGHTGAGAAPAPRPPAPGPAPRPAAPRPAAAAPAPLAPPVVPAPGLEATLRDALASVRSIIEPRGLKIDVQVAAGVGMPRCTPEQVKRAVAGLAKGISGVASGSATLRCEKKPVLLRGRSGEEMRRDFLMLALVHGPGLSSEDQQRVLQGADTGALGETWRVVREVGGFVRFAPASTGLETRLFIPA
jgi:mutual gliding-motility protein MglA